MKNLPAECSDDVVVTIIDLLRHGEPEGGRMYRGGGTDHPLSDEGNLQMLDSISLYILDDDSVPWQAVVSSPMLRCSAFAENI